MFEQNVSLYLSNNVQAVSHANMAGRDQAAAQHVFNRALRRTWWTKQYGRWFNRRQNLLDLSQLLSGFVVLGRYSGGVQSVEISQIVGSEGRSEDFDASFNPLSEDRRDRWVSVAFARLQGLSLPLVELVQVIGASGESRYFVRDGHHRISVARAFGQEAIEANVTIIRLSGRLPWDKAPQMQADYALTA